MVVTAAFKGRPCGRGYRRGMKIVKFQALTGDAVKCFGGYRSAKYAGARNSQIVHEPHQDVGRTLRGFYLKPLRWCGVAHIKYGTFRETRIRDGKMGPVNFRGCGGGTRRT